MANGRGDSLAKRSKMDLSLGGFILRICVQRASRNATLGCIVRHARLKPIIWRLKYGSAKNDSPMVGAIPRDSRGCLGCKTLF